MASFGGIAHIWYDKSSPCDGGTAVARCGMPDSITGCQSEGKVLGPTILQIAAEVLATQEKIWTVRSPVPTAIKPPMATQQFQRYREKLCQSNMNPQG